MGHLAFWQFWSTVTVTKPRPNNVLHCCKVGITVLMKYTSRGSDTLYVSTGSSN